MDKRLIRVYRQTWHKGRNNFAVVIDGIFLMLLLFLFLYLVFRSKLNLRSLCVALSCFFTLAFFLFYKITSDRKFCKHIARLRADARRRVCQTKLLLMDEVEYSNFFSADSDIFPVYSAENVTANDIREAYNYAVQLDRDHIDIIAFSQPTKAASNLMDKLDIKIKIISPFDYKDGKPLEQLLKVSESEIDTEILRTHERKRKTLKQLHSEIKLFSKVRALRYLSIGGVLMIFSMFMRYSMYYRIIAVIAISAGSTSYMFEEIKKRLQNEKNTGET